MIYAKSCTVVVLLLGLVTLVSGARLAWRQSHLEAHPVAGKIVDSLREDHGRRSDYFFAVTYTTAQGEERHADRVEVTEDFFRSHVTGSMITQPLVEVRYDELDPLNVSLEGRKSAGFQEMAMGLIFVLMGAVGCGFMYYEAIVWKKEREAWTQLYFGGPRQGSPHGITTQDKNITP